MLAVKGLRTSTFALLQSNFMWRIVIYAARGGIFLRASVQGFCSEQCPEGFVAVVKNTLRILSVDNVGETFNQSISRLRYTPRRLLIHPDYRTLIVAESDYQAVPIADNPELQKRLVVSG